METRAIYTERKTFVRYDDNHYLLYLNEEVLENHVPEGHGGEPEPEPCTAYAYTGTCEDGGTLIEPRMPRTSGSCPGSYARDIPLTGWRRSPSIN